MTAHHTPQNVVLYDTTLRDGLGMEGLTLSLEDKLVIVEKLDELGVHYIEGGYPGSNPKDAEFFERARALELRNAKLVAFGSTRRAGGDTASDPALQAVLGARTPAITLVGKSSAAQVRDVLETSEEENLAMIEDSVRYLVDAGREVIFDAEHFFDGYAEDPSYAMTTLRAATRGGAGTIALCDTNGGSLSQAIVDGVTRALAETDAAIGIHTHNDAELAVANTLLAVQAGATQVQACLNGWGERCGNANIISVIANLQLKLGLQVVDPDQLARLTEVARFASEVANLPSSPQQPYVGTGAFAHKAGLHAAAVEKSPGAYTHINPADVGNGERVLISELSGRRSITAKLREQGSQIELTDAQARTVVDRVKAFEARGFQYESAEASFELLVRRTLDGYIAPFDLEDFLIVERRRHASESGSGDESGDENEMQAEAMVKVRVGKHLTQTAADGNGPVSALDAAVRSGLAETFPELAAIHLVDYKVRIINPAGGADAAVRALIESSDGTHVWRTVGASTDVIEASWLALQDAYEYWILNWGRPA
ncbi:MAG: citramalate synthase [Dehalococcoidia bacterium]|jgi:2-isopropylmalate synthase|nr:citramalate synthase [Dehalococcoidia bacterium]